MVTSERILFFIAAAFLTFNTASANDNDLKSEVRSFSDLSQLSNKSLPSTKANKLITKSADHADANTDGNKVAVNKTKPSKAMIGKFRINGI